MKTAIETLEIALDALVTNEPIHRTEGNTGQADADAARATEIRSAIGVLLKTHTPTPCCGYTCGTDHPYPVMWNEFNGVVQCHNCGETYTPDSHPPDIRGYWSKDGKFHEGMPPVGEPNPEWRTPPSVGKWMPFESAPKDGTHILVWGKELEWKGTDFTVAHYRDDHWHLSLNLCCGPVGEPLEYANNQPTHWMPLPPEPA